MEEYELIVGAGVSLWTEVKMLEGVFSNVDGVIESTWVENITEWVVWTGIESIIETTGTCWEVDIECIVSIFSVDV